MQRSDSSDSSDPTSSGSSTASSDVPTSSQLPSEDDRGTLLMVLNAEEYTDKMRDVRTEYEKKSPNRQHMKFLLKMTYPNRRAEIKRMDTEGLPMMSSVIIDWSCFLSGEYVSVVYRLIKFSY